MQSKDFQFVIIGAGVIGLAIARTLAKAGFHSVLIIEQDESFGRGISSRNSEVIHSGVYYPKDSLKAMHCLNGRKLLYDYCIKNSIWHNQCGKIIVADENQKKLLFNLYKNAKNNNVPDLILLDKNKIQNYQNNIKAVLGLYIGCSGIISAHELMNSFYNHSINSGHDYLFKTMVLKSKKYNNGYLTSIKNSEKIIEKVSSEWVINCSGLGSDRISNSAFKKDIHKLTFSKGDYFKLSSKWKNKFNHLIYPLPNVKTDTLGIHISFDKNGIVKLGPSAKWLKNRQEDYVVDEKLKNIFFQESSKYIKNLNINDLSPDYSGIRPKFFKNNESQSDFYIEHEDVNGLPKWINLIGIDSPGLTSCLSIAEVTIKMINDYNT